MTHLLYFDGSSYSKGRRGGPGPSAGAAVLIGKDGEVKKTSVFIRAGESNSAEYQGLLSGLGLAEEEGVRILHIFGDSRNVIDQVLGLKSTQKPELLELLAEVQERLCRFDSWSLTWIPRRKNGLADEEARRCIQERSVAV